MTCGDQIASALAALSWWHVLLAIPAGLLWGASTRIAELSVGALWRRSS